MRETFLKESGRLVLVFVMQTQVGIEQVVRSVHIILTIGINGQYVCHSA